MLTAVTLCNVFIIVNSKRTPDPSEIRSYDEGALNLCRAGTLKLILLIYCDLTRKQNPPSPLKNKYDDRIGR